MNYDNQPENVPISGHVLATEIQPGQDLTDGQVWLAVHHETGTQDVVGRLQLEIIFCTTTTYKEIHMSDLTQDMSLPACQHVRLDSDMSLPACQHVRLDSDLSLIHI